MFTHGARNGGNGCLHVAARRGHHGPTARTDRAHPGAITALPVLFEDLDEWFRVVDPAHLDQRFDRVGKERGRKDLRQARRPEPGKHWFEGLQGRTVVSE